MAQKLRPLHRQYDREIGPAKVAHELGDKKSQHDVASDALHRLGHALDHIVVVPNRAGDHPVRYAHDQTVEEDEEDEGLDEVGLQHARVGWVPQEAGFRDQTGQDDEGESERGSGSGPEPAMFPRRERCHRFLFHSARVDAKPRLDHALRDPRADANDEEDRDGEEIVVRHRRDRIGRLQEARGLLGHGAEQHVRGAEQDIGRKPARNPGEGCRQTGQRMPADGVKQGCAERDE